MRKRLNNYSDEENPVKIHAVGTIIKRVEMVEVFNATLPDGTHAWFAPNTDGTYTPMSRRAVIYDIRNVINLSDKRKVDPVTREKLINKFIYAKITK